MALHNDIREAQAVTLEQMLEARESRAALQRSLLARYARPLLCFTLNLPGQYKAYPLARRAFCEGEAAVERQLARAGLTVLHSETRAGVYGYEGFHVVDGEAARIKRLAVAVEEAHPLGRLFDLDVLDVDGTALRGREQGRAERGCLICGRSVWECARSRAHTAEQLAQRAAGMLGDYFDGQCADRVACKAMRALFYEASVTPKPGLVDRANRGAHRDMDYYTLLDSGCALLPHFRELTLKGLRHGGPPETLLAALRYSGMCAEDAMLEATGGVNTHKGLIFSLGIVCAAAGYLYGNGLAFSPEALFALCARAAAAETAALEVPGADTAGRRAFARYGLTGARGEAAAGFPGVREHGYPCLRGFVAAGYSLNDAGARTLLHLLAHIDDTNMVNRSDLGALREVQARTARFLAGGPDREAALAFAETLDREFIERGLSPGGCADLLALSFLVFFLFEDGASESDRGG